MKNHLANSIKLLEEVKSELARDERWAEHIKEIDQLISEARQGIYATETMSSADFINLLSAVVSFVSTLLNLPR